MAGIQPNNAKKMEDKRKYVFVTGASSGIGRYIAVKLSAQFNIILHGRDKKRLEDTLTKCDAGNQHLIFMADLNQPFQVQEALTGIIVNENIEIIHFVHCAGFMKMLPLKMVTIESINETFSTNVFSAAIITKVLTQRKINGTALKTVVFISSNISNFGAKAFSVYAASKGALDSLMRSLAVELAPNIRVNSVLPGAIPTEMTSSIFEDKEKTDRIASTYPLGLGEPHDIYEMVNFLLSEKSKWITGQQFTVDGGRTINITG